MLEEAARWVLAALLGAAAGSLGTLATWRSQFTKVDQRFALLEQQRAHDLEKLATTREHDRAMLDVTLEKIRDDVARNRRATGRIERRQRYQLEVSLDIAKSLGLTKRERADTGARTDAELPTPE